jgi:predicted transposase/invertase (TIGR01784 family)
MGLTEAREKARMVLDSFLGDARYEGRQEGLQEGRQEEKLEVAWNLLREKMPVDVVSRATGLSLDEINRLAAGLS